MWTMILALAPVLLRLLLEAINRHGGTDEVKKELVRVTAALDAEQQSRRADADSSDGVYRDDGFRRD